MSSVPQPVRPAGLRDIGVDCPHCARTVCSGESVVACPTCGTVNHKDCWSRHGQCGSFICAPDRRDPAALAGAAVLKISASDLQYAPPLLQPRAVSLASFPPAPPMPRWNRLAIAALICALAGIPLFGALTGVVAVVLGCLALGAIRTTHQKGLGLALVGVFLGLADAVGWIVFLCVMLSGGGPVFHHVDLDTDLETLKDLDPRISRGMRANVLIGSRFGVLRGERLGSGVILKRESGVALILTNRHVVDPDFSSDPQRNQDNRFTLKPDVRFIDQLQQQGQVVWLAPGGVDLALVRARCPTEEAQVAKWKLGRRLRVGDPVFAIGNPNGLGWTHTQGTISQFRNQEVGTRRIRIIQTQAVLNPGNSGGGLYDTDGYLVGIASFAGDKRISEGLNFAIAFDSLSGLAVPDLNLEAGSEEAKSP